MIYAIGPIYIKERSNSEMQSHIDAEVRLYKSNYHYSMVHQEIACIYITVSSVCVCIFSTRRLYLPLQMHSWTMRPQVGREHVKAVRTRSGDLVLP